MREYLRKLLVEQREGERRRKEDEELFL